MSILAPNSTPLIRELAQVAKPSLAADASTGILSGFKRTPSDELLYWLIWEYGLGEILPYVEDLRQALQQGILWQRIRGTPRSMELALSWLSLPSAKVEQEVPGLHFYEFQLDTGEVVNSRLVEAIKGISLISAPLRSRLTRLHHEYDIRRLELSAGEAMEGKHGGNSFGAFLSDDSGYTEQGLKLSFGRTKKIGVYAGGIQLATARLREHRDSAGGSSFPTLDHHALSQEKIVGAKVRLNTFAVTPQGQPWLGYWDSRLWKHGDYIVIGVSHNGNSNQ